MQIVVKAIWLGGLTVLLTSPALALDIFDKIKDAARDAAEEVVEDATEEESEEEPSREREDSAAAKASQPAATQSSTAQQSNPAQQRTSAPQAGGTRMLPVPPNHRSRPIPESWDVKGIRLGMSVTEVERIIRTTRSNPNIVKKLCSRTSDTPCIPEHARPEALAKLGENPFVIELTNSSPFSSFSEAYTVQFVVPPSDSGLAFVRRGVSYNRGKEPSLDNTVDAVIRKYGQPTTERRSNTYMSLAWDFDIDGQVINEPNRANKRSPLCNEWFSQFVHNMRVAEGSTKKTLESTVPCDYRLYVTINHSRDGLVRSMSVELEDVYRRYYAARQRMTYLENRETRMRQQELDKASEREPDL